jgi:ERCC4-type nuclease
MIIKIDCREKALLEECNKQQLINDSSQFIKIISENIPLGDIIIYDDNNNEKLIIERKTLLDLAASIRDGRYTEQGFRLDQCSMHNHNIIYLIEGDLRYYKPFKSTIDKKALLSSMVSINYFKGFSLFRTITLTETAEWLLQMTKKLHKESSSPSYYKKSGACKNKVCESEACESITEPVTEQQSEEIKENTELVYSSAMKRVKKENINPANIGEIMLSQIPGVSNASAIAIMNKYSTIQNLIEKLATDDKALINISISDKSGKLRKINKTCILNIYKYLLGEKNTDISNETDISLE